MRVDMGNLFLMVMVGLTALVGSCFAKPPSDPRMYMAAASKQVGGPSTPFPLSPDLISVHSPPSSNPKNFFVPQTSWFFPPPPIDEPGLANEEETNNDDLYDQGWINSKRTYLRSGSGSSGLNSGRRTLVARNANNAAGSSRVPQNYNFFRLIG